MGWQDKLKLEKGYKIVFVRQFDAGHLGQEERKYYEIVNSVDAKVGEVKYVEHMDTKAPFHRSFSFQQYDLEGNVLVSEQW
ncbi:hypothetical protein VB602_22745 [Vibrio parahaemolyticus]|uniref:hypothetical protein n=1 Tax=Vibrio parahaemolyticus TaxID=670 RepID=UPI0029EACF63|nr:hypothetical protein [Vibrio parahaemolyticus]MBE4376986.1 hypothetical protein [Vibrio parahaemolyticus]MEA5239076.1 hypothetical protein [Vibrio parahaemolyticus]HCG9724716.1 hypothetical protein [Vibrio parahaemolyticus]